MSTTSKPPFRAEHVGSLLRSREILEMRRNPSSDKQRLRALEDAAIERAVERQQACGLQVITDGEIRRDSWHMDFLYQIGGVKKVASNLKIQFRNQTEAMEFSPPMPMVTEKLHLNKTIFADDFIFLKSRTKQTPKLTIPSPNMIHYRGGQASIEKATYPDIKQFWSDLADVYAAEIIALRGIGCTYLQIDDTSLASFNDPKQRETLATLGGDPKNQHLVYIDTLNRAVAGRPKDMTVMTHLCRGNYKSSWTAEGSYEYVAEALFSQLAVDGYLLEFDDHRSGGFEPLRFIPKDKFVVLGLITSKHSALEDKDEIKRRIDAAAKFVPLDRLCLSPQCGFSSTMDGNALTEEQQYEKLRLVADIAQEVWGTCGPAKA